MFSFLNRGTDRRDARQEAAVLVAVHGERALSIARQRLIAAAGRASRKDCMVYTEVKKRLGIPNHQDTATRYVDFK